MMWIWPRKMMRDAGEEDRDFQELRKKIREAKLLCPSVELLLAGVRFTGRLSVVVQNGRILKSGTKKATSPAGRMSGWSVNDPRF
jgi:hypothetical protein